MPGGFDFLWVGFDFLWEEKGGRIRFFGARIRFFGANGLSKMLNNSFKNRDLFQNSKSG